MNATTLHRHVRSDVAVTSIRRRPRAIVVVVGEKLDHYTELYHSLQCSTIAVDTGCKARHDVGEWAVSVSRETARLVRIAQLSEMGMGNVPVMIHIMGSGGRSLVEALHRQVKIVLGDDTIIPSLPARSKKTFNMNASTRSLFTTETEPMSSDDEDDDCSHGDDGSIIETAPLPPRPVLEREVTTVRRRHCAPPSVHRIDMERTGISLQHSLNPEDRAYRRDLETFCSHLAMGIMLWDMPPPPSAGWSIRDVIARILSCLVLLWNCVKRLLFRGNVQDPRWQQVEGLSLARQHALMYVDSSNESVKRLLEEANVVMQAKLHGTRKEHGAEYVAFVQQALDRISPLPADDDGWSSDEEE